MTDALPTIRDHLVKREQERIRDEIESAPSDGLTEIERCVAMSIEAADYLGRHGIFMKRVDN